MNLGTAEILQFLIDFITKYLNINIDQ